MESRYHLAQVNVARLGYCSDHVSVMRQIKV